jgi:hypothetical protein
MAEPPAAPAQSGFGGGVQLAAKATPHDHDHCTCKGVVDYGGEQPADDRIADLIDALYLDARAAADEFRRAVWSALDLPEVRGARANINRDAAEDRIRWTPEEERLFNEAADVFLSRMVGGDLSRLEFVDANGLVQDYNRQAWALGVDRAAELADTEAVLSAEGSETSVRWLLEHAFDRLSDNGRLRLADDIDAIGGMIRDAVAEARNPLDLARELTGTFDSYRGWEFQRLARTEVAFAQNAGQLDEWKAEGIDTGGVDGDAPPWHPNCILPGTTCEAPGGVVAGLRAHYSGPAVELVTAKGRRCSVTVNHMLLTPRGFVRAGDLREGDDIICSALSDRVSDSAPDADERPPFVEDVFSALATSSSMTAMTMPVSAVDLHGDAVRVDGDVYIVGANSLLESGSETQRLQQCSELPLSVSRMTLESLLSESPLAEVFFSAAHASDSIMGGRGHGYASFLAHARQAYLERFPHAAELDSGIEQGSANGVVAIATDAAPLTQLLLGHAGLIEADNLVSVREFDFAGHVYDLQTATTLYVAGGLVSSNCLCALTIQKDADGNWYAVPDIADTACDLCQEKKP